MKTLFFRVVDSEDKADLLLAAIRNLSQVRDKRRFDVDPVGFTVVPHSPFAYWVSERLRRLFTDLPAVETENRTAKRGLGTDDDFRFMRLWAEVSSKPRDQRDWCPLSKGGLFSAYYCDIHIVLNWAEGGKELRAFVMQRWGNEGKRIYNKSIIYERG